jgi:hypothetical protein
MAESHLVSKLLQLHYEKGHSAQQYFLDGAFSVAICRNAVSLHLGIIN